MKECTSNNPVNTTLKVIGGKWKALILWYVMQKPMRTSDLMKHIEGVTQKMLIQQLRELESDGLVSRKVYPVVPPKVEYSVTEYGMSLKEVLDTMSCWGEEHEKRKNGGVQIQRFSKEHYAELGD